MIVIWCILIPLKIWDNLSLNKSSYQKKKCVGRMLVVMKATATLTLIYCDNLVVSLLIKLRQCSIFGSVLIVKICVAHCSKVIL